MSLIANLSLCINWTLTKVLDLSNPRDAQNLVRGPSFTSGSGANQADSIWPDVRTLADAGNETLDLTAQTDPLGTAITMTKLKALYIKNKSADAGLIVGGAAATPVAILVGATDTLKIPPGGEFLWTAPNADGLTITTNKNLKVAHDGTGNSSLDYEIIAIGVD